MKRIITVLFVSMTIIMYGCQRDASHPNTPSSDAFLEYTFNGKHYEITGEIDQAITHGGIKLTKQNNDYWLTAFNNFTDDINNGRIDFVIMNQSLEATTYKFETYPMDFFTVGYAKDVYGVALGYPVHVTITKYSNNTIEGNFSGSVICLTNGLSATITGDFKNIRVQ